MDFQRQKKQKYFRFSLFTVSSLTLEPCIVTKYNVKLFNY